MTNNLVTRILQYASGEGIAKDRLERLKVLTLKDLELLNSLGLEPFAAYIIKESGIACDDEIKDKLLSVELTARYLATVRRNAILQLHEVCAECYLLKGSAVVYDLYPCDWIRLMGDIDILIENELVDYVSSTLSELGYKQESDYPQSFYEQIHHLMPFYHRDRGVWIEVHTAIFPKSVNPNDVLFSSPFFFKNEEIFRIQNKIFHRPAPELNLIYTMTHWVVEFRARDSAGQLLDIIYLLKEDEQSIDWNRLIRISDDRITATSVYICLGYLINSNVIAIDDNVWEEIRSRDMSTGKLGLMILFGIINSIHSTSRWPLSWLGKDNLGIIWRELLKDTKGNNYLRAMTSIIFPPARKDRFSLKFQSLRVIRFIRRFHSPGE